MTTLIGRDVDVYFNLHKKVWSVRDRKTRRVIAHVDGLVLSDVTFRVSAAGNARVRSEGRKNVHAFARGKIISADTVDPATLFSTVSVTYNPYKYTTFVNAETEQPIHTAAIAWMSSKRVMALLDATPHGVVGSGPMTKSRPGLHPTQLTGDSAYDTNTRTQSNGGRSLKAEHLAITKAERARLDTETHGAVG